MFRQKSLRDTTVGVGQTLQRCWKIQELTDGARAEHPEGSRVRAATPVGFGTCRRIIDQQQHVRFLLREKDRWPFPRVNLVQYQVVEGQSDMAHLKQFRALLNPLRNTGRGMAIGQFPQDLRRYHDLAIRAGQDRNLTNEQQLVDG